MKASFSRKAGFSLLEVLIAMAVIALGATVILTRASSAISQVTDHTVFFDFQRQVSDLRRQAYRAQAPIMITAPQGEPAAPGGVDPAQAPGAPQSLGVAADGAEIAAVTLRRGWTYTLSQPLRVEPSGQCRNVSAELITGGKTRVRLVSSDNACHFTRYAG